MKGDALCRSAALLCWATLLGGCINDPGNPVEAPPAVMSSTTTTSSEPSDELPPGSLLLNQTLHLDSCTGGRLTLSMPGQLWPGTLPEGWRDDGLLTMWLRILECQRIAVGPFERGPVFVLQEMHMHVITDSNCAEGEYSDLDFLEAFWVNDQEVAAYLNQTYGMPASYAEFQVTEKRDGPALTTTWTFGPPGRTPSLLEAVNPSDIPEAWTAGINRLSWINQFGGITYLDYEQEEFYTSPNPLVTGKLRPPLPYTTTEAEDFVGTGRPVWGVEGSGAFHQFRDLACDEPL